MAKIGKNEGIRNLLSHMMRDQGVDPSEVFAEVEQVTGEAELAQDRAAEAASRQPTRRAEESEAILEGLAQAADRRVMDEIERLPPEVVHPSPAPGRDASSRAARDPSPEYSPDASRSLGAEAAAALSSTPRKGSKKGKRKGGGRRGKAASRFLELCRVLRHPEPPDLPRNVWGAVAAIMWDTTGQAAAGALAAIRAPGLARKGRKAALGELEDGSPRLDWSSSRARAVVATLVAIWRLGGRTTRNGFARVCSGIGRHRLRHLMVNPQTGKPYSLSALFGTQHRGGGSWRDGSCGYVEALEQVGAFYRQQPPAARMPARLVGLNGYAYNLYWFPFASLVAEGDGSERILEGSSGSLSDPPAGDEPARAPP